MAFHAAHVGVLDASDVVVEVGDGFLTIGRFHVGHVFTRVALADLGGAHFIGDVDAAVGDGFEGVGEGGEGATCLTGLEHVLTVGVVTAVDGGVELQFFHQVFVGLRCVGVPAHFELEAAVAQVTRHRNDVGHHVVGDLIRIAGLTLTEEDELDAVEAEQGIAELLTGYHAIFIGGEGGNHVGTGHQVVEGVFVERPRVDVRIDAEVGGGAKEESLAHFPPLAGFEEGNSGGIHVGLGLVGLQGFEVLHQSVCLFSQAGVCGIHRVVEVLFHDGLFCGLVDFLGVVLRIFVAGAEVHCEQE